MLSRQLAFCKSLAVSIKLAFDYRKKFSCFLENKIAVLKNVVSGLGKHFVVATTLVDIDQLSKEMPEECLKYLLPPPERKMMVVANLKMNGNVARLERYCENLNRTLVCLDKEKASKSRGRKYKAQVYPDLVDVVIAPPYPYLDVVSSKLCKDCLDCRDCEDCTDCSQCNCDCADCKNCKSGEVTKCCKHKCFEFDKCDVSPDCERKPAECEQTGTCECADCGTCDFCQSCYRTDCEDCQTCIQTAAQNSFPYLSGGFSGEVSPRQSREMGARWVIIGNSERRELFQESDELIAQKIRCALIAKMKVIFCVSDTMRDGDNTDDLERQMMAVIPKIGLNQGTADNSGNPYATSFSWDPKKKMYTINGVDDWQNITIAYEPTWALKKGIVPTPLEAQTKMRSIREIIEDEVGVEVAKKIRIIYGGPVDTETAPDFADLPDIDGFLVGTMALKLDQFVQIINAWYIKNRPDASEITQFDDQASTPDCD